MKICFKCMANKSLDEFGRDASGHDGLQASCKECVNAMNRARKARNPEHTRAVETAYVARNADRLRAYKAAWYATNKERIAKLEHERWIRFKEERGPVPKRPVIGKDKQKRRATTSRYYFKHKAKCLERTASWRSNNPGASAFAVAKRRANQLTATPLWANRFFMKEAYRLAAMRTKMFGFRWQVDHTIPLQSDVVCGLHCEANLAVIPQLDNVRKSNRVWPDMP
jgi:hypothetical protein